MKPFLKATAALLACLSWASCSKLQNNIDVALPSYASELVVECYLQPGEVPSLAVTSSLSYLSSAMPQVPTDVTVTLYLPNGAAVPLNFAPNYSALRDTSGVKFHTHIGRDPLVARPGDVFRLDVRDTNGRHATSTTTMLAPIPIDSLSYKFNGKAKPESRAYILTAFKDPATPDDCYRLQLHRGNPARGVLRKSPEIDNSLEDRLLNGQAFTVGTSFRFWPNDTITATLYHTERAFYRFRQSIRDARDANGNPFAQPSAIYGNVQGGIGIFAVLSASRAQIILP